MASTEGWQAATWEGARRAQLRRALERTVRERLQSLEALADTSRRLVEIGREARARASAEGAPGDGRSGCEAEEKT